MSKSLRPQELRHNRLSCPSLSSGACSNSCQLSEGVMPSNHLILCRPFLPLPKIFPSIGSLSMSRLFASGGQTIGASGSTSPAPQLEAINSSAFSLLYHPASHLYMTTGKTIVLTIWTFAGKVMALLFNTLSSFDFPFLPRSKYLLISRLHSPPTVILEPKKIKSVLLIKQMVLVSYTGPKAGP